MESKFWYKKVRLCEAEEVEKDYYSSLSIQERLHTVQVLREMIDKFGYENRKGLRRVFRIIQH